MKNNEEVIIPACTRDKGINSRNCLVNMNGNTGKRVFAVLLVLVTLAACITVIYYWDNFERFQNWGYLSALIFGFVAGSSLPVPLPYLLVTFSLGGLLNPLLVGLTSGLGAGIGGTLVYLVGSSSSHFLPGFFNPQPNPEVAPKGQILYQQMQKWTHRRGPLVIFLMSAILNPVFAPMAITAGAMRFGLWRFLLWCLMGNLVKSMAIAYCGYFGLAFILRWTGG
ncbi:MAG: VTT domain-containing protein [Dehalococcoidales bacterium]|jgi:membrane protein YqaA with SNARE-associated domain